MQRSESNIWTRSKPEAKKPYPTHLSIRKPQFNNGCLLAIYLSSLKIETATLIFSHSPNGCCFLFYLQQNIQPFLHTPFPFTHHLQLPSKTHIPKTIHSQPQVPKFHSFLFPTSPSSPSFRCLRWV